MMEESNDFHLVSEILKTLMHHMKSELQRIDRLYILQTEYTVLQSSLDGWLEKTPDLTPLKTLRSSIKSLKSQLRHRLADKADLEEGDDSNSEELSQVVEDLDHIRGQLHEAFNKEDGILVELSKVVNQHFPELCTHHPEMGIDNALKYGGLVKLGRSLEQYHTFPLEGSTKKGVLRAKYRNQDVVLKEYIIEESLGLCKKVFLEEAVKYANIKSPHLLELQGVFFLKSERHAYVQLPYYEKCLGNLSDTEIRNITPHTRYHIIKGVLSGLKAVHDAGLLHGALHPNNVFINDKEEGILADFYFSVRDQRSRPQSSLKGLVFTCPESQSSKEGDMYCLGLLIVYLYQPHGGQSPSEGPIQQPFGQMDPIMQGIVQNLLQETPMERYSATELMNESYFREMPSLPDNPEPKETTLQLRPKSPSVPAKEKANTVAARLGILKAGISPSENDLITSQTCNDSSPDSIHLKTELCPTDSLLSQVPEVSGETSHTATNSMCEVPVDNSGDSDMATVTQTTKGETEEAIKAFDSVECEQSCLQVNAVTEGREDVLEEGLGETLGGDLPTESHTLTELQTEGHTLAGLEAEGHTPDEVQRPGSQSGFSDVPSLEPATSEHGDSYRENVDLPPEDEEEDF